jgi:hypothetical protein
LGACKNAVVVPCVPRRAFTVVTGGGLDSALLCLPVPLPLAPPPPSLDPDPSLLFPNGNLPRSPAKAEEPLLEEVEAHGSGGVAGEEEGRPIATAITFPEFAGVPAIAPEDVRQCIRSGVSGALEGGAPLTG